MVDQVGLLPKAETTKITGGALPRVSGKSTGKSTGKSSGTGYTIKDNTIGIIATIAVTGSALVFVLSQI